MTMLFRLLLALLLATFAMPGAAPAACHDAIEAAPHAMATDRHPTPRSDADAVHGCIGCIPPSDWLRAPLVAAAPASRPVLIARAMRLDVGQGTPPALPPPRTG
ncbi:MULTISPECIES: hypothetical protein [Sphingomonas]|uniref:hypothetical protein n=2 Tax=Sphingomonas TaxID=13687 RepID=UPI00193BC1A4|nr:MULTISPECIES: hypothetical protein [Sphingomonas]